MARMVRMDAKLRSGLAPFVNYLQGPEHLPFRLPGGPRAALLVHGFPGSPAEMRPLGEALQQEGWTVEGLLLPGFGKDIETLFERSQAQWAEAVREALAALQREYPITLLVGLSMGGALAAGAAAAARPTGLILLAPFWKLDNPLWSLLPALARVIPSIRPFRLMNVQVSDPQVRKGIRTIMPGVDPGDPQVLRGMRDFAIPTRILVEVRKTGLFAARAAPNLKMPVLVLQGTQDESVKPGLTRRLALRIQGRLAYREFPAAHDLTDPSRPAWPAIVSAVLNFAHEIAG